MPLMLPQRDELEKVRVSDHQLDLLLVSRVGHPVSDINIAAVCYRTYNIYPSTYPLMTCTLSY